jgi:hypothetical protein
LLKSNEDLWSKIWKSNYDIPTYNLARMEGLCPGSLICNNAWSNKYIIHEQCFWEVKNGTFALFWEDSWQQKKRLLAETPLQEAQSICLNKGKNTINHY